MYTIQHEDVWIESAEPLSWVQKYNREYNYSNLTINQPMYNDYQPTYLQFHLSSETTLQSINMKIKYANRLTRAQVRYCKVCKYDEKKKEWHTIKHSIDKKDKTINVSLQSTGSYCVFVNHYWYSTFTQRLADEYPLWSKIRQDSKSTGQQFLNFFGMELEDIKDYLDWVQEQKYINTADIHTLDWVQLYKIPNIKPSDNIKLVTKNNHIEIPVLETLKEFFYNDRNQGGIIDYREMNLYTVQKYGDILLQIIKDDNKTEVAITPIDYHIWNTFDEFGLLLGVQRMHLEKNLDFKERILDVFRYPAGSHDIGLTNGIARELNLIQRKDRSNKKLIWKDDSKDFLLKNKSGKYIDTRTLRIDNQPLQPKQFHMDEYSNIRIFALNTGKEHEISFIYGIKKYQLYDKNDEEFHKILFESDGQATPTLLNWVEYINTVAPVMWDHFKWDEGYWDTIDKQLTGLGYIPNMWDSNIDIWKDYQLDSNI
ncbi:low copy number virion structural protein [Bacillus cereus]|uniref:low copy number virion structural protein n=1 Tax=Bacillus cereus TaxID=1396 RepID=UPI0039807F1D